MPSRFGWRLWGGMAAAALVAVLVSFVAGCLYPFVLVSPEVPKAGEVAEVLLFVGGTSAIVAGIVAIPVMLLVGLPLYVASIPKRMVSLRIYSLGGLATSFTLSLILTVLHAFGAVPVETDFYFAVICALIEGPLVTSVFWAVVRPDLLPGIGST